MLSPPMAGEAATQVAARTALVVGGRGFLGEFMVAALRRAGWKVRVLARPAGRHMDQGDIAADITRMLSPDDWAAALDGVGVVVNAAGMLRETGRQTFEDVHVRAPLALAQACAGRGIRFVQVSALGDPRDGGFVESKHRFDAQLLAMPLDAVVLRPSVVYSHQGSYGGTSLLRALAAFPFRGLLPGDGHWAFQPVCAEDLAEVVVGACQGTARGVHEVGCAVPITLRHYQECWRRWLGVRGERSWCVPLPLVRWQVRLGQWLGRGPVNQTLWNMLLRGNVTAAGAHERVAAAFGVAVRPLADVLATRPALVQDRWAAQLYFLAPWLEWSVIVVWLVSGVVGLSTPAQHIEAMVRGSVLAGLAPVALARSMAVLDLVLGILLIGMSQPRPVVLGMLVMTAGYLLGLAAALPATLALPLGGVLKNLALIPALAVLYVLVERR